MTFNNLLDQLSVFQRQDLTSTEKLVACALLSFRNSETGRCNPSIFSENSQKETVCTRTSLTRKCVINSISNLEKKSIIKTTKEIGKPTSYQFVLTRVSSTPVNEVHPCTSYTPPVYDVHPTRVPRTPHPCTSYTPPVYDVHPTRVPRTPHPCTSYTHNKEITNKEQISNKEEKESDSFSLTPTEKTPRRQPLKKPENVTQQTWDDFNAIRKAKKAPITETALKRIQNEADKAGISLEAALQVCCERGWQGFKAEWYLKDQSQRSQPAQAQKKPEPKKELSPDDFTDKQISFFAYKLSRYQPFGSKYGQGCDSYDTFATKIEGWLRHPRNFLECLPYLKELHLVN